LEKIPKEIAREFADVPSSGWQVNQLLDLDNLLFILSVPTEYIPSYMKRERIFSPAVLQSRGWERSILKNPAALPGF
jgi:hypothetical protein